MHGAARLIVASLILVFPVTNSTGQTAAQSASQPSAKTLFAAAFELYQAGQFEAAINAFQKGLAMSPRDAKAHYYLADCYEHLGKMDQAIKHYQETADLAPTTKEGVLANSKIPVLMRVADEKRRGEEESRRLAESSYALVTAGLIRHVASGLYWTQLDNGSDITWVAARSWCEAKGSGWRLPTVAELRRLHKDGADAVVPLNCGSFSCRAPPGFVLTSVFFWSSESGLKPNEVLRFQLYDGREWAQHAGHPPHDNRALCVRGI